MHFIHHDVLLTLIWTGRFCSHRNYLTTQHIFARHKLRPLTRSCLLPHWMHHAIVSVLVIRVVLWIQRCLDSFVRLRNWMHCVHLQNILLWCLSPLLDFVNSHWRMQRKLRRERFGDVFIEEYFSITKACRCRWLFVTNILRVFLKLIIDWFFVAIWKLQYGWAFCVQLFSKCFFTLWKIDIFSLNQWMRQETFC